MWSRINRWADGWWGVLWSMALGFAAAAFVGVVLLDHDADHVLPLAAVAAGGSSVGQVIRVLRLKRAKAPAWPTTTAPPPGRPD